jgi:hypothetical protein
MVHLHLRLFIFVTYSLLVSESAFSGSALKEVLLDKLFIYVAWGEPGEIYSQLTSGTKAWAIGISDDGILLNPAGEVDALMSIFINQGRVQVSQNAGIKCFKGISLEVRRVIAASGIEESSFFSSVEEDEFTGILTLRADFDLIISDEGGVSFNTSNLYTSIFDDETGELSAVCVGDGNSRLASVAFQLDADLLRKSMICYVADGTPVTKGDSSLDDGLYIGPRNYIVLEIEAGGDYVHFRLDQDGFEDL